MEKDCECYEEEVQPYPKTDYKPIIYIIENILDSVIKINYPSITNRHISVLITKYNL